MGWDNSRPVPWTRLAREWVIYALVMTAIVLLVFDSSRRAGMLAGVLISGPLYLVLGAVLAKFGYQRKTLREMRSERPERRAGTRSAGSEDSATTTGPRPKPPPTRRTSTGPNRPRKSRR